MGGKNKKNKHNKNKKEPRQTDSTEEDTHIPDVAENDDDEQGEESRKREKIDDESDQEDAPKKKKKKKKAVAEQTADKKGKKSIRQMKREKFAQRQAEAQAESKDQLKSQCITYLSQWKHDKQNWKFMKAKQVWLYKNKFSPNLVPDSSWNVLLEYFESAQGNIRNLLLEDANKLIAKMDEWTEAQTGKPKKSADDNEELEDNEDGPQKPDDTSYKRARDLLQCLQE